MEINKEKELFDNNEFPFLKEQLEEVIKCKEENFVIGEAKSENISCEAIALYVI